MNIEKLRREALANRYHTMSLPAKDVLWLCDEVAKSRTLADQQERDAWQPIETAPRDGTKILAYQTVEGICVVCRDEGDEVWLVGDGYFEPDDDPKLWMPLPVPPAAARTQEPKT